MIYFNEEKKMYYVHLDYYDKATGKRKHTNRKWFKLKRKAQEVENKLKIELGISPNISTEKEISEPQEHYEVRTKPVNYIQQEQQKPKLSKTFSEVSTEWEDSMDSSETSRRHHREHFELRFKQLYNRPIEEITIEDIMSWRKSLADTDYSVKTKNTTISYVRSVYKFANGVYGIQNVSVVLRNFKKPTDTISEDMQVWTVEEFNQFIEYVKNPLYQTFFKTLFWTGARRGEIIALHCEDLLDHEIYIQGSIRNPTTQKKRKATKTGVKRKVTIDDDLYKELLKLKEEYKTGYLFGGETSCTPTTIDRQFQSAIERSGVKKIRLHDLRHSHATILINGGVNIVAVSKRLGHADINQTLKTYTHLLEKTNDEMMEYIEKLKKE